MQFTVEQLIGLRRVQSVAVSPDGTWAAVEVARLAASGAKYVSDLWRLPLAGSPEGSPPVRLTDTDSKDGGMHFRPDGGLYFLSNRPSPKDTTASDDERPSQIWLLPPGGFVPELVTDEPDGVSGFVVAKQADVILALVPWLGGKPDQRAFLRDRTKNGPSLRRYTTMPVRFWDHWIDDPVAHPVLYARGARVDLAPDLTEHRYREVSYALSPDGTRAAVAAKRVGSDRIDDDVITVFDTGTGAVIAQLGNARTGYEGMAFSPDGQSIATVSSVRTDGAPPLPILVRWDFRDGRVTPLATSWDREPHLSDWAEAGIVVTADEQATTPVFLVDAARGSVVRVTTEGASHQDVHAVAGGRIVGIRHGTLQPPEVFACTLGASQPVKVVSALTGIGPTELSQIAVVEQVLVESDGASVRTLLVLPRKPGPHPTLFWIHGGPMGQWSDTWHWRWNPLVFVSQGYAVALPNPRGSTGEGRAFLSGIWGNTWGAGCYDDLMRVADTVEGRSDIGPVAAMGGSFGGYMSNWIGGNTDRFKAIVTHASIFSFSAFHGTTDFPAWWALELGSTPYSDPVDHDRYSPQRFVPQWKTPTLVVHGEKDYRCPIGEGLSLFEALQMHGVESELLVFPDEGHWILKPRNIVAWYTHIATFLAGHVRAAAT